MVANERDGEHERGIVASCLRNGGDDHGADRRQREQDHRCVDDEGVSRDPEQIVDLHEFLLSVDLCHWLALSNPDAFVDEAAHHAGHGRLDVLGDLVDLASAITWPATTVSPSFTNQVETTPSASGSSFDSCGNTDLGHGLIRRGQDVPDGGGDLVAGVGSTRVFQLPGVRDRHVGHGDPLDRRCLQHRRVVLRD